MVSLMTSALDLRVCVPAPRETVWQALTEPDLMNQWSTAQIKIKLLGAGQTPDGVGTLRTVSLPGPGAPRLLEVVRVSEWPLRFEYAVIAGVAALRRHRGEITLRCDDADPRVTWVRWRVEMEFVVPGLALAAQALIGRELRKSLERLSQFQFSEPEISSPRSHRAEAASDVIVQARSEAEGVLAQQRAIADRLHASNDPKQWFARVYQYVTEEQLAHLDAGEVAHPEWVLRLIPAFHDYYATNLLKYEAGEQVEPRWAKAWRVAERADVTGSSRDLIKGLLLGVAAHIEADLPRALAGVHQEFFAETHDYAAFRADYLQMGAIFGNATARLLADMPRGYIPGWLRFARSLLPAELSDVLMRRYYDVPRKRLEAFEAGRAMIVSVD